MSDSVDRHSLLHELETVAEKVLMLAATGVLRASELRRLADRRAVAWYRLEPRPTDPIHDLREGFAAMRARLARLTEHDPSYPATLLTEDDTVYTYRPRTVLRRVLDHALDHLNQIEQWMRWRTEGIVPTPTDGWASSSSDVLDEDFLPLSEADLAAWRWRIDVTWGMLAERAARLSPEELDWLPQENEWTVRRILHHVAGGFYTVWLDERLPDEPTERYAQASGRLLLRAHRALTAPSDPACTYYADGGLETTPEAVIRAVLECEYAALAAAQ